MGIVQMMFGGVRSPVTVQFTRNDFNPGKVTSAVISIDLLVYFPFVTTGDFVEVDSVMWDGSWASGYEPRQRWFIKYGTAYNPAYVNGGSNKNHQIQCRYAGSNIFQIAHRYTGDNTDFPQNEISINRLVWKSAFWPETQFNTYLVQLPL